MPTYRIASLNFLHKNFNFTNRLQLLQRELTALHPDIICLQEINDGNLPQLVDLMRRLGYPHVSPPPVPTPKHWQVTFTRQAAVHQHLDLGVASGLPATLSVTKVRGTPIHVLNVHLIWGGQRAGDRLHQVSKLAAYANHHPTANHILLVGDLNSDPGSAAIQYLTGMQPDMTGAGTYWVDARTIAGTGTAAQHITSESKINALAAATARAHDHDPAILPARRIDYILSHGWRYGGPGTPIKFGRFADTPYLGTYVSDHYGIWADIRI